MLTNREAGGRIPRYLENDIVQPQQFVNDDSDQRTGNRCDLRMEKRQPTFTHETDQRLSQGTGGRTLLAVACRLGVLQKGRGRDS